MQDKRLPPTPKRIADARKKGDVAISAELSSSVLFVGMLLLLWALSGPALSLLAGLWSATIAPDALARPAERLPQLLQQAAWLLLLVCAVVCVVAALFAAAGSFVQVGGLAVWSRLKPDIARLNPGQGLERLLSMRNVVNLAKMVVKTLLIGALVFAAVRGELPSALRLGYLSAAGQLASSAQVLLAVLAWAAVIYLAMAAVDVLHQRFELHRKLHMSIVDLRREQEETEGSPLNEQRRRAEHQEVVFASLEDRLARATLVVQSRTAAVALQYLAAEKPPRIVAKAESDGAETIRRLARERGLFVEDDAALAESLLRETALDQPAPQALFRPLQTLLRRAQGLA